MPAVVRIPGSLLRHTHTVGKCKLTARHHHYFPVSAPVQAAQLRPMRGMEFAKTVDLGFKRDRGSRRLDRIQHRGKHFVAVARALVAVAIDARRAQQPAPLVAKTRIVQGLQTVYPELDRLFFR